MTLAGPSGSAGFGLKVLLDGAMGDSVEFEVYPGQFASGGTADGVGLAVHSDVLGALHEGLLRAGKEDIVQHRVDCVAGTERIIARGILRRGMVGILPLLRTDMLQKVAERLNKPLRGGVLVLEWRRYPS